MLEVELATDDGDILIREDEVWTLGKAELNAFRISRADLERVFAVAAELMQGVHASDRVRPCASETLDGKWEVHLVRYSALNDPLLHGEQQGKG